MALDLNRGAHGGWSPFPGKRKFLPHKDSGVPLLAPAFFKKTPGQGQSRPATVPTVGAELPPFVPLGSRALLVPLGAEKARTVNSPISPPSGSFQGLELRVEVPCRGEVRGAVTAP